MTKRTFAPFLLLGTLMLTACGHSESSFSPSTPSTPPAETTTPSSSFVYPTFAEAIANTSEYAITTSMRDDYEWFFEVNTDDCFYLDTGGEGYILLDSDPDYYHAFVNSPVDGSYGLYQMEVNGRRGPKANFQSDDFRYGSFMSIIKEYQDDFSKIRDDLYGCSVAALGTDVSNYFMSSILRYANYFEIEIDENGRLSRFLPYEMSLSGDVGQPLMEIVLVDLDLDDYGPYARWKEAGRQVNVRIFDLKSGYFTRFGTYACPYASEKVTIEATVNAVNGNSVYLANEDSLYGFVGIRAELDSTPTVKAKDIVTVSGTIRMNGYVPYIDEATVADTGNDAPYLLVYDEETIVDSYGGGAYASSYFTQAPYFADSLYSTFAYVESEIPSAFPATGDLELDLTFPKFVTTEGERMKVKLVIPASLSTEKKTELLSGLAALGRYSEQGLEGSFSSFLVGFDMNYDYLATIVALPESTIAKRPTFGEKVEQATGLKDFPVLETSDPQSFRFGGSTGMYIESNYGLSSRDVTGVFYGGSSVTPSELEAFKSALAAYGFVKIDEIRDTGGSRHEIHSYDGCIVDMLVGNAMFGSSNYSVQMWVYRGELIQGEKIEQVVEETVGDFFDVADFVKPVNSYSADYDHFALLNFAGHDFSEEDPLHCFTIDLDYNGYQDVYNAYRDKGYSFYRNSDGTIYTYITRGSSHYVMYKGDGANRVYVDLAYYPTTDYTYAGHDDYTYRIEVMIYHGEEPLSAITTEDLTTFEDAVASYYGEAARFDVSLPSGSKVEFLKPTYTYEFLEYGYYTEAECFIYGNVEAIYTAMVEALEAAGYAYAYDGKQSVTYSKTIDAANYLVSNIVLMKNADRGFVRVINGTPGMDF